MTDWGNYEKSIWREFPALTEELMTCIEKKMSGREAAAYLSRVIGRTISRSAVIGKADRMGTGFQSGINGGRPEGPQGPRAKRAKREVPYNITRKYAPPIDLPDPIPMLESFNAAIPVEQRKTLFELNGKTCRYPVGDPGSAEFFFCGGETVEGSYCSFHARVCFNGLSTFRAKTAPAWK